MRIVFEENEAPGIDSERKEQRGIGMVTADTDSAS
jgi:hypothetical protein